MTNLRKYFRNEVAPALMKEHGLSNPMQVPSIAKIVLNIGLGEALTNSKSLDAAVSFADCLPLDLMAAVILHWACVTNLHFRKLIMTKSISYGVWKLL